MKIKKEDARISVRVDPPLKEWYDKRGGSKEFRKALILYYEAITGLKYTSK